MAEYITKKAAIKAVENAPIELFQSEWEEIEEAINAAPTADVAPVVHGEWVHPHWGNSGNCCYDCSVCGNEAMHKEYKWKDKKIYPICPWCGAKMDGGVDNETD